MRTKYFTAILWMCILFVACRNNQQNTGSVFYVNYVSNNDSLVDILNKATAGKISYFDNDKKLQVVSLNYVTEEHPNTHYFKVSTEIPADPPQSAIKYDITFNNSMLNDSIAYSVRKYIYVNKEWKQRSDMGSIKVFDYLSNRDKNLPVIKKNVAAKVLQVIANDSYSR